MNHAEHGSLVYIVDDDDKVRAGLARLLEAVGYRVKEFNSAEAFMAEPLTDEPSCLILDVKMPGTSGPALQERMVQAGSTLPVIFLSGHADVPTSVNAMKLGAVDFLQKPCSGDTVIEAVAVAIEKSRSRIAKETATAEIRKRWERLTGREQEIMAKVISGALNKHIAAELGLHEQTIKHHRGSVMRKMNADSLADLVRMASRLGVKPIHVKTT